LVGLGISVFVRRSNSANATELPTRGWQLPRGKNRNPSFRGERPGQLLDGPAARSVRPDDGIVQVPVYYTRQFGVNARKEAVKFRAFTPFNRCGLH
jgi:hypothetical protein